jgi:hypothetical protein
MRVVLLVYEEVAMENEAAGNGRLRDIVTVSVDEKPGVQATANTAPDLPPVPGQYSTFARDHEYVRHGTWSILAGLDLFDGGVERRMWFRTRRTRAIGVRPPCLAFHPETR